MKYTFRLNQTIKLENIDILSFEIGSYGLDDIGELAFRILKKNFLQRFITDGIDGTRLPEN